LREGFLHDSHDLDREVARIFNEGFGILGHGVDTNAKSPRLFAEAAGMDQSPCILRHQPFSAASCSLMQRLYHAAFAA
jgi:hypothetical protein